jgi:hypothetical protein
VVVEAIVVLQSKELYGALDIIKLILYRAVEAGLMFNRDTAILGLKSSIPVCIKVSILPAVADATVGHTVGVTAEIKPILLWSVTEELEYMTPWLNMKTWLLTQYQVVL